MYSRPHPSTECPKGTNVSHWISVKQMQDFLREISYGFILLLMRGGLFISPSWNFWSHVGLPLYSQESAPRDIQTHDYSFTKSSQSTPFRGLFPLEPLCIDSFRKSEGIIKSDRFINPMCSVKRVIVHFFDAYINWEGVQRSHRALHRFIHHHNLVHW